MKLRDNIQFTSDLPEGGVEDENDFLVYPAGPVTEAIREVLITLGCQAEPVYSVEFKGWEFNFRYRGRPMWCRASIIDRYIAFFMDRAFWSKLMTGGKHPIYVELLTRLNEALARDGRFQDVRWYALDEIETEFEGLAGPVG